LAAVLRPGPLQELKNVSPDPLAAKGGREGKREGHGREESIRGRGGGRERRGGEGSPR